MALNCIGNAQAHRIKLLGIDTQPPLRPAPDPDVAAFFEKLQTATNEELEAELELYRSRSSR